VGGGGREGRGWEGCGGNISHRFMAVRESKFFPISLPTLILFFLNFLIFFLSIYCFFFPFVLFCLVFDG